MPKVHSSIEIEMCLYILCMIYYIGSCSDSSTVSGSLASAALTRSDRDVGLSLASAGGCITWMGTQHCYDRMCKLQVSFMQGYVVEITCKTCTLYMYVIYIYNNS